MRYVLKFSTHLGVSPTEVWIWMTSVDGISKEMAPFLHMSSPKGISSLASVAFQPGERLFRSWITLFGIIPFGYSDLTLVQLKEGQGFIEQSPMGTMRFWRHERSIVPQDSGCILTDELTFEPRLAGWLTSQIVYYFFKHRHRRLVQFLG
jgi:ligand-binding SRPBCC domain-containing protein